MTAVAENRVAGRSLRKFTEGWAVAWNASVTAHYFKRMEAGFVKSRCGKVRFIAAGGLYALGSFRRCKLCARG